MTNGVPGAAYISFFKKNGSSDILTLKESLDRTLDASNLKIERLHTSKTACRAACLPCCFAVDVEEVRQRRKNAAHVFSLAFQDKYRDVSREMAGRFEQSDFVTRGQIYSWDRDLCQAGWTRMTARSRSGFRLETRSDESDIEYATVSESEGESDS